jgi:hypothetical protein
MVIFNKTKKNKLYAFNYQVFNLFQITTFWWFLKFYIAIVNSLKKNTCIMCIAFPSCLHKHELHIETTSGHDILCWYTFSFNNWNLIIRRYTGTNMCAINCTDSILQAIKKLSNHKHL